MTAKQEVFLTLGHFFPAAFVATEPGKPIESYRDDVFF